MVLFGRIFSIFMVICHSWDVSSIIRGSIFCISFLVFIIAYVLIMAVRWLWYFSIFLGIFLFLMKLHSSDFFAISNMLIPVATMGDVLAMLKFNLFFSFLHSNEETTYDSILCWECLCLVALYIGRQNMNYRDPQRNLICFYRLMNQYL